MKDKRKQKLIDLGVETLADALLELATFSDAANNLVERLSASPKDIIQRFKKKLSSLKRSKRFIDWRNAADFSRELEMLLLDLQSAVSDPLTGAELVAAFYEADESIFGRCDDSSGFVGDVFRVNAQELFIEYASRCTDKEKISNILLHLNRKNNYGVRDVLIHSAGVHLPEPNIRNMISVFQGRTDKEIEKFDKSNHLMLVESLAQQILDAKLFERTRLAWSGKLSTAAFIDIARIYLKSDDIETAHTWLKKIPQGESFQAHERDQLLLEIYTKQGDNKKLTELLYQKLRHNYSLNTLQALLDVIGHEQRDQVLATEISAILDNPELREADAEFLIAIGEIDAAEDYLIQRADQFNGNYYNNLLSLAKTMVVEKRDLVAYLIYRSLLVSILERGYSKAYPHGIRYLKKLDKFATAINDWKTFDNHAAFKDQIYQQHGRKRSFWSNYETDTAKQ